MNKKDLELLSEAYQKISEDYRLMKGEPDLNPPEYYENDEEGECPKCGGKLYDAHPDGLPSSKWEWLFKCENEDCDYEYGGDNLPY